jgi:hypothetical protein
VRYVQFRQVLGNYRYRSFCSLLGGLDELTVQRVFLGVSSLFLCQSPSSHWSSLIYHRPLTHTITLTSQHIITFTAFQLRRLSIRKVICSNADISEDLFRMLLSIYRSIRDSSFNVSQLFSFGCVHLAMPYSCSCQLLPCVAVLFEFLSIFFNWFTVTD